MKKKSWIQNKNENREQEKKETKMVHTLENGELSSDDHHVQDQK